jgi:hypothetical protein
VMLAVWAAFAGAALYSGAARRVVQNCELWVVYALEVKPGPCGNADVIRAC